MTATCGSLWRAGLGACVLALFLAGCASDQPDRPAARGPRRPPPPPLAGSQEFFAGQLLVELRTGRAFDDGGKADLPGGPGEGGERRHGGGMSGGFRLGGMGGGEGGGGRHRSFEGGNSPGDGPSMEERIEQQQASNLRHAAANGAPPVLIHLRVTNRSAAHVDVRITDFLSAMGNFVVEPEKLALDAGQSAEVEPMTSRLAGELAQVDVTLELRLGKTKERKTVTLTLPATLPAPPAPAESH